MVTPRHPASAGGYAGTQVQLHTHTQSCEKKKRPTPTSASCRRPSKLQCPEGLQKDSSFCLIIISHFSMFSRAWCRFSCSAVQSSPSRTFAYGAQQVVSWVQLMLMCENSNSFFLPGESCDSKHCRNKWGGSISLK